MSPPRWRASSASVAGAATESLAHAVAWVAAAKWLSQLASWLSTIVVARLLTPEDFGLVAMAQIFLGLVAIFTEFGLASAIIAHPELTEEQVGQLHGVSALVSAVAVLITCAVALPLGRFFMAPQLPLVVMATSPVFVITGFRIVPNALLQRDFRFRYLAITESLPAIVVAGASVGLAALGFQYWTLVIGAVLGSLVATALAVAGRPCRLIWPRLQELSPVLAVSRHLLMARLVWWVQTNADLLVIGRLLGNGPLGAYTIAMSVASLPLDKVTALVNQVSPPFLSAAQADRPALRRLLLVLTGVLAVIVFPLGSGLALVAREFALAALGPKWTAVVPALRPLAVLAAFRGIQALLSPVVVVTGGTRLFMYLSFVEAAIMTLTFYVGSGFGIAGVALGWLLVHPIARLPVFAWVFRHTGITLAEYLRALWPAVRATAPMVAAVGGLALVMPPAWTALARLAAQVGLGALTYLLVSLLQGRRLREMYDAFRALSRAPRK